LGISQFVGIQNDMFHRSEFESEKCFFLLNMQQHLPSP
jgi:hypothetical protein